MTIHFSLIYDHQRVTLNFSFFTTEHLQLFSYLCAFIHGILEDVVVVVVMVSVNNQRSCWVQAFCVGLLVLVMVLRFESNNFCMQIEASLLQNVCITLTIIIRIFFTLLVHMFGSRTDLSSKYYYSNKKALLRFRIFQHYFY